MDLRQRRRIVARQRHALKRHGHDPAALYWSSREAQEIRFRVLAEIGVAAGASVLDVGCGFGDLHGWLVARGVAVDYTGVDLSPDLVAVARTLHPDATFFCGDLFDFDPPERGFDWVLLSGALNEPLNDGARYARQLIRRMFVAAARGAAFNMLDARRRAPLGLGLACHDPERVLAYCRTVAPRCELRDDYLDNDFTLYLHRQGQPAKSGT